MRLLRLLATLLVLLAIGVAPAYAAQPVQLSNDGRTWAPDLPAPLFDPAVRWVPGDVREASFWVRNAGPDAGTLSVTALVADADGLLAKHAMRLRLRDASGSWTTVAPGSRASLGALADGARTRVVVSAAYAAASGNDTERDTLRFSLRVRLTGADEAAGHAGGPSSGGHAGGQGPGGLLPGTGNPVTWWLCLLAAISLGGGTALVVRSKRRDTP